jgi:hypothetical protein
MDAAGNDSGLSDPASATTPAGPLVFTAAEDATVKQGSPARNFGASPRLEIDASPVEGALIKFQVAGVNGRPISRAVLRLYANGASDRGGEIQKTATSSWSQGSVTWATAPGVAPSSPVVPIGPVSSGRWIDVDVTSLVGGDGTLSLRIRGVSADDAVYRSRESSQPPQLVLTVP